MKELVRVHAKAQNRCALGIMHAFMLIKPEAKLEDLRRAFPNSLNPDKGVKENFVYAEEKGADGNWDGFFKADSEVLTMGDGKAVSVVKMWTKPSFERLIEHAKQYGIVVASFEEADKGFGKRGEFHLEYLNGFTPKQKGSKLWLWILLAVVAVLVALFLWRSCATTATPPPALPEEPKVSHVVEEQVEALEQKFNDVLFEQGQATLRPGSESAIRELASVLTGDAKLKLRVEGHASVDGDAAINEVLALKRAEAIVSALQAEGIATERLEAVGKGTANPISDDPAKNRRVELIIYQ